MYRRFPRSWRFLFILLLCFLALPFRAQAQGATLLERRTLQFSLLYPPGSEAVVEQYAQFVDAVYEEASLWWGYRATTPIVLRIYPTLEAYAASNPLAATVPGVIAHAHTGRREISIALPQTAEQTPEEVMNNVRHELTHIIAADVSGGKLTTMWQEGIAQNAEKPSPELERKMEAMRQIIANDRILPWASLNDRQVAYSQPQISYPESYTIAAFLLRRNGMATFRTFVEAMRQASSYRGALQTAYQTSAEKLEAEWRAQLADFVAEGYKTLPKPSFDFTPAEQEIARGDYGAAMLRLNDLFPQVQAASDAAALDTTTGLMTTARNGERATMLAEDAHTALSNGNYADAYTAATAAAPLFDALAQPAQARVARQYAALAQRGTVAAEQLVAAQRMLQRLQITSARTQLAAAYTTFTELGDANRARQAQATLISVQHAERVLALALVVAALLIALWNVWQRRGDRRLVMPYA